MRCLCCNKDLNNPTEYEASVSWHSRCIKNFFGTKELPELDVTEKELEKLANSTVSKGLTVPGVQKKLSLHLDREDKVDKLTIVDYPTGYILKPPSNEYRALPESEFLVMKMADAVGINVTPCALIKHEGEYSYITKRVDRLGIGSVKKGAVSLLAMEDFCQLSYRNTADKYKSSYENCAKVIGKFSKNVGLDQSELFYRLLFCFVIGNSDMHLKNFSLIEDAPGSREFGLSPAYDLLPVNVIMPADKEQMALALNGKKRNIRRNDFLKMAATIKLHDKTASKLMDRIIGYEDVFKKMASESYMPDDYKASLENLISERVMALKKN